MTDRRLITGVSIGLLLSVITIIARGPLPPAEPPGTLVSDCDGALHELVIQYTSEAAAIVETPYRQFLRALPAEVTVHVVVPGLSDFEDLEKRVGAVSCRLLPVPTGHPMTSWARDRWLALTSEGPEDTVSLLAPRVELGAGVWRQRAGDQRIAEDLEQALSGHVRAFRSSLEFDGGDFVGDSETVFVTPGVLARNPGYGTFAGSSLDSGPSPGAQLDRVLSALMKRRVVPLPEAPPHHAGMFLMAVGGGRVLVGDPSFAQGLVDCKVQAPGAPSACPIDSPDFSPETQRLFDAVAETCRRAGYEVVRIPVLPDLDGRTYLTYLNVIIDQGARGRTVYMPVYQGAEALNQAGEAVWRSLGYEVRRIDCTTTYRHGGSLRCLVNVLSKDTFSPVTYCPWSVSHRGASC